MDVLICLVRVHTVLIIRKVYAHCDNISFVVKHIHFITLRYLQLENADEDYYSLVLTQLFIHTKVKSKLMTAILSIKYDTKYDSYITYVAP